jgi:hypothetical protein
MTNTELELRERLSTEDMLNAKMSVSKIATESRSLDFPFGAGKSLDCSRHYAAWGIEDNREAHGRPSAFYSDKHTVLRFAQRGANQVTA